MPIDRTAFAQSAFTSQAASYDALDANTGEGLGGEWPPAGEWPCYITDVTMEPGDFKYGKGAAASKVPADIIQFHYVTVEPIPSREVKEPLEWKGARFILPKDESSIKDEGNLTRIRIEKERLKGHLKVILGKDNPNPATDLLAASDKITAGKVAVKVKCDYRAGKARPNDAPGTPVPTYKTEFLTESMAR